MIESRAIFPFCTILGKILTVKDGCIFLRQAKLRKDIGVAVVK